MTSSINFSSRREFVKTVGGGAMALAVSSAFKACGQPEPADQMEEVTRAPSPVYIGTYTNGASEGIYRGLFDYETGALTDVRLVTPAVNPSYLTVHPNGAFVLAVNEVTDFEGASSGAVSAFSIADNGDLRLINQQPSRGGAPCYISTDPSGKWALVANYGGGNIASFPVGEDGRLGEASSFVQHEGSSVNPNRQQGPHAHFIRMDPAGRFVFAVDLGLDKVMIYALDSETGMLTPNEPAFAAVEPGAGPRHLAFTPDSRYAFVINELNSTIVLFRYDGTKGELTALDTMPTLPAGFEGNSTCADIHVHPNGRFVYGSNRGHDSIVMAAFDADAGALSLIGHEPTEGGTPRNFTLDPTGAFLLAANQRTDTVVVFRIDQQTGRLTPTGNVAAVPTPVCLKFA